MEQAIRFVAIVGIEFYNSWKDPEHPDWNVDVDRIQGPDGEQYARFFVEARTMRRGAWRREFTARAINDYFREGFGVKYLPLEELPTVQCGPFRPEFSYRRYVSDQ